MCYIKSVGSKEQNSELHPGQQFAGSKRHLDRIDHRLALSSQEASGAAFPVVLGVLPGSLVHRHPRSRLRTCSYRHRLPPAKPGRYLYDAFGNLIGKQFTFLIISFKSSWTQQTIAHQAIIVTLFAVIPVWEPLPRLPSTWTFKKSYLYTCVKLFFGVLQVETSFNTRM